MAGNQLLEAALHYASLGWRVMPLIPRDKNPWIKEWQNNATTDEDQIRSWWKQRPQSNVGILTGNGLCVIDVDNKPEKHNGILGDDVLREWEAEHGEIAETVCCKSPTGGMHYYYDIGDAKVRKCEGLPELSIDLRCDGGLIVAPPSIHPDTGTTYEWDISPDDMTPTKAGPIEKSCIQYIWDHSIEAKRNNSGKTDTTIPKGKLKEGEGRNTWLYTQGCSIRGKGADDDVVAAYLTTLNKTKCLPPLDDNEIQKTINSVCTKPIGLSEEAKQAARKSANHVTVSKTMIDKYSACFLDGAPAIFDGLSYRVGWDEVERAILREWPNSKDRDRKEVVKYLTLTMPHEKQSPPNFIGFKNGVLDVSTMELMSFSPEFRIPNVIPHDWNQSAQSDVLDGMLRRVACGNPFIESNLCEFIGLSMYRSSKYAYAAILLGQQSKTASNGKSTYIDMIRNILGDDNYSSLSLRALGDRFNQQYLSGKLANLGDDISSEFTDGASLEVFKKAVSGSKISTDVKNSRGYEFTPYCTMVFSANKFPKMEKLDDGTLRRMFPIRFNAYFTKDDPDFDPDIGEKLKSEEAIEAAIVRGISGLRRVIAQRCPTENDESKRMLRDIETDNNTILQWVDDDFVNREWLSGRETSNAYSQYIDWCKNSGVRKPYGKNQFSADICSRFDFRVQVTRRETRQVRIFADA